MSDIIPVQVLRSWVSQVAPLLAALLLLLCSAWVYWPGVTGPELLDDRSSVLVIKDLQSNPERAWDYVFGDNSGALGRSVSMASFVLEKLYLDEGLAGSKKVNIVLHLCNGGLVIWLFWLLFRFHTVPGYRWLAVLLGAGWLLHPLLVSTVLYVVQRMAMLSTFFMLCATVSYVYWRLSVIAGRGGLLKFIPVPIFLFIGLFAKENTIVVVPTLLLLEVLWFACAGPGGVVIKWLQRLSYTLIAGGSVLLLAVLLFGYDSLAARFHRRPFTIDERLLTQSRIVWDYVRQLLAPQVQRMGLYHDDIVLSRSLTEPLSTLYAVLAWALLALGCACLLRWQTGRWLFFGFAWFLLGHSIESTVWPLEMYFEHRNYFPAIGLALAIGVAFAAVVKRWPEPAAPLLVCIAFAVLLLSTQTSSQVQIWSNRSLLILNHLNAHPRSARANNDMAVELARHGELEAALRYSHKAFEASTNDASTHERQGDFDVRNLALSCIANKPSPPAMIDALGVADPKRPLSSVSTLLTFVRMLQDNRCPQFDRVRFADRMAAIYLSEDKQRTASSNIYSNLAVLENALERYDNALAYVQYVLDRGPNNKRALLMKLHFATALGETTAVSQTIASLQDLDRQGKLNVREQQNLALYLEK